jgi:esterase
MKLYFETLEAPHAIRTVLFLHGILGSGQNLRAHARRLLQADPTWQPVLVDLRAHGKSLEYDGQDSIQACANDIAQLQGQVGLPIEALVGHSFGGKVALLAAPLMPSLRHVMTWDSAPGTRLCQRGSELTAGVMAMLRSMPGPWPKREDFANEVLTHGFTKGIGQWLAMNLVTSDVGFHFALDLSRIDALLTDFFALDAWPILESNTDLHFHLLFGTASTVYDEAEISRARGSPNCTLDAVEAGHWIHVDAPEEVARLLALHLRDNKTGF